MDPYPHRPRSDSVLTLPCVSLVHLQTWTWAFEVFSALCMLPVLFTSVVFYNPAHVYSASEAAVYAAISPVVWSAGLVTGTLGSVLGTKCESANSDTSKLRTSKRN